MDYTWIKHLQAVVQMQIPYSMEYLNLNIYNQEQISGPIYKSQQLSITNVIHMNKKLCLLFATQSIWFE